MNKVLVIRITLAFTLIMFGYMLPLKAQVNGTVELYKAYDPTVGDAYKINILPEINDTSSVSTNFKYKVFPKQLPVSYQVTPIQPAKMVGEPLTKLYSTYLKAGYGNYNTMLGEAGFNLQRSKNYAAGLYVKHLSSISNMKLENDIKSPTSYSDNKVELFGKKIYDNSVLHGEAFYSRNVVHYYGYDTSLYHSELEKDNVFQRYSRTNANVGLFSNYLDSTHINYDVNATYEYFEDDYSSYQNWINVNAHVDNYYKNELIGGIVNVSWVNKNSPFSDTINNALVVINPFVRFFGDQWRVQCGLAMNVDAFSDTVSYHFYPTVLLQYNVIDNFLIPFVGFDGGMIQNHFSKMTKENMYLFPGIQMKNTNNLMNLHAGIRGNFSKRISFLIKGNYELYKNMYFFVNDTNLGIGNYFNVVYDDETQLLSFNGEIAYKNSEKLNFFLRGNYYKYTLKNLEKPWHKPGWDVTLTTHYSLRNKIVLSLDIFAMGDRYAQNFRDKNAPFLLKKIIDANLGIEYRYSKILSAFININNITAGKNYYWNFYPTQQFQVLGGLTYSF
jgi:hypothetical protein